MTVYCENRITLVILTIPLCWESSVILASHCCFQTILPLCSIRPPILNFILADKTIYYSSLKSYFDPWVYLLNSLKSLIPGTLLHSDITPLSFFMFPTLHRWSFDHLGLTVPLLPILQWSDLHLTLTIHYHGYFLNLISTHTASSPWSQVLASLSVTTTCCHSHSFPVIISHNLAGTYNPLFLLLLHYPLLTSYLYFLLYPT